MLTKRNYIDLNLKTLALVKSENRLAVQVILEILLTVSLKLSPRVLRSY